LDAQGEQGLPGAPGQDGPPGPMVRGETPFPFARSFRPPFILSLFSVCACTCGYMCAN